MRVLTGIVCVCLCLTLSVHVCLRALSAQSWLRLLFDKACAAHKASQATDGGGQVDLRVVTEWLWATGFPRVHNPTFTRGRGQDGFHLSIPLVLKALFAAFDRSQSLRIKIESDSFPYLNEVLTAFAQSVGASADDEGVNQLRYGGPCSVCCVPQRGPWSSRSSSAPSCWFNLKLAADSGSLSVSLAGARTLLAWEMSYDRSTTRPCSPTFAR